MYETSARILQNSVELISRHVLHVHVVPAP